MKFRVTFKDPDTLGDAIALAVREDVAKLDLSDGEREAVEERRHVKIAGLCATWFRWGEYVTIEIDTDAKTATVIQEGN